MSSSDLDRLCVNTIRTLATRLLSPARPPTIFSPGHAMTITELARRMHLDWHRPTSA
jgi:hypothetical protein